MSMSAIDSTDYVNLIVIPKKSLNSDLMRFASRKLRNIELKTSLFFRHSREAMLRTTFDTETTKKIEKKISKTKIRK